MQIICIVLLFGIALAVPTSKEEHSTTASKKSYIVSSTVPKDLPEHCVYNYVCKKKSKITDSKECVKFCVAAVTCDPPESRYHNSSWCTEIHADYFFEVLNYSRTTTTPASVQSIAEDTKKGVMQVNMIDFPCQPGYLPDRRGRCREVW